MLKATTTVTMDVAIRMSTTVIVWNSSGGRLESGFRIGVSVTTATTIAANTAYKPNATLPEYGAMASTVTTPIMPKSVPDA